MRRRLPPNVEKNIVKGHIYLSYRVGKGSRTKLPSDPTSDAFKEAYAAAIAGEVAARPSPMPAHHGSVPVWVGGPFFARRPGISGDHLRRVALRLGISGRDAPPEALRTT